MHSISKIDIFGAGLYGATCARLLADKNYDIIVYEKNNYIGGHCADEWKDGICVSKYGPHVFHTGNKEVWDFVNRFANMIPFELKVKVQYKDQIYSFPINLLTLSQVYGKVFTPHSAQQLVQKVFDEAKNFEEAAINLVGKELYEIFFYGYTKKQWGCEPRELPVSIFSRIPIRYTYDDRYFQNHRNLYQGLPENGYSDLIKNILDHKNIKLVLNSNIDPFTIKNTVIYTGPIDSLFKYCYGKLPYRSLKFIEKMIPCEDSQGGPIVNYTQEEIPYTRITEYKHLIPPKETAKDHTIIVEEYPADYNETETPFYPIVNDQSTELYHKYLKLAAEHCIHIGGRLGNFIYADMDISIQNAMKLIDTFPDLK